MRAWRLGVALLLTVMVAGCGGNKTAIGVTVLPTTAPLLLGNSQQFFATISGISATTSFWQICLPVTSSVAIKPTTCTIPQGPAGCPLPTVTNPLVGFGTVTSTGLYTAPAKMPSTSTFDVVASSCANDAAFGIGVVQLDSGVRVSVVPSTATLGSGQMFQFSADVTGTNIGTVSWTLSSPSLPPPPATNLGSISATGLYTAPPVANVLTVTVTATSVVDSSQSGSSTVTVVLAVPPALTTISPTIAAEGSAQQDVYLNGLDFFSGTTVLLGGSAGCVGGAALPSTSVIILSSSLLRATIPASFLATPQHLPIQVQNFGGCSGTLTLAVTPATPALIASSFDSLAQSPAASANLKLTGGFYVSGKTTATFNGMGCNMGVCTTFLDSRDLSLAIPAGLLGVPGLYPIVVQNPDAASAVPPIPSQAALNLAVTPVTATIPAAASGTTVTVGTNPSAIAIDYMDDVAVVANQGDNTISRVNLATDTAILPAIPVGHAPTGVAVDDMLTDPVALVVNSADQTVTAIDLTSMKTATLSVSISAGANPPLPFSVGINPITPQPTPQSNGTAAPVKHRAIVAYQSTNLATVLDVSENLIAASWTPVLSVVQQVGAGNTSFSTGTNPAVAIDPRLNWALITPGGTGTINVVDLGRDAFLPAGDNGRTPQVVANLSSAPTLQGAAINSETHQAFLTDPNAGNANDAGATFSTFSLLNQAVVTGQFQNNGFALPTTNFVAAAVDPLANVGIAVNSASDIAIVADLENGIVLQKVALANTAVAVAVDPVSNQAVVVSPGAPGNVSFVSLGSSGVNPLQIVESNPSITYLPTATTTATTTANLPLEITGGGFATGASSSQVLLDGTALPGADVTVVSARRINAIVPASLLTSAHTFSVQVQNPNGKVSNVADLTVIQPIAVGASPAGVAVDTARDVAVVTNSGDNTATLVALTPQSLVGKTQAQAGKVGPVATIPVGADPIGVAVLPRLGLALIGDNQSNSISLLDVTQNASPQTVPGCVNSCSGELGVAMDQDIAVAAIANSTANTVTLAQISTNPPSVAPNTTIGVDPFPTAVAIDPLINAQSPGIGLTAVTTASQSSSMEFVNTPTGGITGGRLTGLQVPTDVIFDPVNQDFLAADSLENQIVIVDPVTFVLNTVNVGINPTSLDYNFQASTLVTANKASQTMSVVEYVCPPPATGLPATCPGAQVRAVLGVGGSQSPATAPIAPQAIAVDPRFNFAVTVDPDNNRVLEVPLSH